ncbi:sensor histidine kinase [Methylobacterium sp. Leaf118]|uniref:sensor histidine kinase n=1 Tax=Methylobacterium sp. Leaf118 TaxID=2876562 RepID=UPI001E39D93A|nr:HAMP domain-containing sensor histidine kinase [Methylobacterium sp. Leaf118]
MRSNGRGSRLDPRRLLVALGLRFEAPAEERRFVQQFILDDIGRTQAAMGLGALIYAGFGLWDWIIDPVHWPAALAIRLAVTGLVLLPLAGLLFFARARGFAEAIYLAYCVVPGCCLPLIYRQLDGGFDHAAAGMIIIILFVSTLLPLRVPSLLAFCAASWACFAALESTATLREGMRFINNFEIGMSYALSLYATTAREYRARREFRTRQDLRREKERSDATLAELRRTQMHLVQAEKHAALGQLVAGIAHEVNTPVGLALTVTTTLAADARHLGQVVEAGPVRRSELVTGLQRLDEGGRLAVANLTRAADLMHTFKQVAVDQTSGERRIFAIGASLRNLLTTLEPVLRRQRLSFALECPEGLRLDSYPGALAQVVGSLALNAAAHAYPDGRPGTLRLTAAGGPDGVRLVFSDDGVGIAPEHLPRVFDPFFTTTRDQGSLGLGLHIVFNLVVSTMRGRIEVESEPGLGTRYILALPDTIDGWPPATT